MHLKLTRADLWTATLGASAVLWASVPIARIAASLLLLAHVPVLVWGVTNPRSQFFGRVLCRNRARSDATALTFDDGPDPSLTPAILDLLDKRHCRATFFVVARRAQRHPELVVRARTAGHTIACHDLSHGITANLRLRRRMTSDIGEAQRIIADISGLSPALYRPPVGLMNPHVLPTLRTLGMTCVGWSSRAGEGGNRRPAGIARIPALRCAGEVVLLHDILPRPSYRQEVLGAIDRLLQRVNAEGLAALTADTFLNVAGYIERDGPTMISGQ